MTGVFLFLGMLTTDSVNFLQDLSKNNNREWFHENKPRYQAAYAEWTLFVQELIDRLAIIDPRMRGTEAKKCTFRLFRDIRFSKDKTPYKTHFGAFMAPGGRKTESPGYYVQMRFDKSFCGAGYWHPQKDHLAAIRQEIDYNAPILEEIVSAKAFKKHFKGIEGDELKTAPKGYPKDHPQIHWLKKKSFVAGSELSNKEMTSSKGMELILEKYQAVNPLVSFLQEAIS